ncbi:MAG: hypothetical protein L0211_26015 [Planctomycetaceae bacterium]|nr:hypothetical protein [Planctomycetaceae bacterium]
MNPVNSSCWLGGVIAPARALGIENALPHSKQAPMRDRGKLRVSILFHCMNAWTTKPAKQVLKIRMLPMNKMAIQPCDDGCKTIRYSAIPATKLKQELTKKSTEIDAPTFVRTQADCQIEGRGMFDIGCVLP